ncbi:DnaJ-domain-containing protein [Polyplosphaeria fusca]|uniref:DnaJ-domain-containing protein n=1 Tax=Polyplosphaeria fusca TaxID=682080 RepID=A0A9P4UWQ7_9PLEO|nr:DnaJ-domain-containing protein [Polyplosphaeria fusca]
MASQRDEPLNHYELLGVAATASSDDVKATYRTILKENHPDKTLELPQGERERRQEALKMVNNAVEVLLDEEKRATYDRDLTLAQPPPGPPNGLYESFSGPTYSHGRFVNRSVVYLPGHGTVLDYKDSNDWRVKMVLCTEKHIISVPAAHDYANYGRWTFSCEFATNGSTSFPNRLPISLQVDRVPGNYKTVVSSDLEKTPNSIKLVVTIYSHTAPTWAVNPLSEDKYKMFFKADRSDLAPVNLQNTKTRVHIFPFRFNLQVNPSQSSWNPAIHFARKCPGWQMINIPLQEIYSEVDSNRYHSQMIGVASR